jgi:glycosyltransferase involved in cell wall biosynthesis
VPVLKVLCVDVEGGFGGSSRSLFESIRHLDRRYVDVEVWCGKSGPIQQEYKVIGVSSLAKPDMPRISSLPRLSRNLFNYGRFCVAWMAAHKFRRELLKRARQCDIVHLNHESLFLLARWLRCRSSVTIVMHMRTLLPVNAFSRWQISVISRDVHFRIFITENEERHYHSLSGHGPGRVIFNSVTPGATVAPHPSVMRAGRFLIACLSNYAWVRGVDRLVDIAAELKRRNINDVVFVLAGATDLPRSLPGTLGRIARAGGSLIEYAAVHKVDDMFIFLGRVPNPGGVLTACDLLIKPTREGNPWGRDILEAMAQAKPALSIGTYSTFVENGVTGILLPEFSVERVADSIVELLNNRPFLKRLGEAAQKRVLALCDGRGRAAELLAVWQRAAGHSTDG